MWSSPCRVCQISALYLLPDWVCDVQWVWFESLASLFLVLVTAHNALMAWKPPTGIVNTVQCKENCILYPTPRPTLVAASLWWFSSSTLATQLPRVCDGIAVLFFYFLFMAFVYEKVAFIQGIIFLLCLLYTYNVVCWFLFLFMCLLVDHSHLESVRHFCNVSFLNHCHSCPSYTAELRVMCDRSTSSVVIAAGTMFGQVLVWTVSDPLSCKDGDGLGGVCLRMVGHKVRERESH